MRETLALAWLALTSACATAQPPEEAPSPRSIFLAAAKHLQELSSISFSTHRVNMRADTANEQDKRAEPKLVDEGRRSPRRRSRATACTSPSTGSLCWPAAVGSGGPGAAAPRTRTP